MKKIYSIILCFFLAACTSTFKPEKFPYKDLKETENHLAFSYKTNNYIIFSKKISKTNIHLGDTNLLIAFKNKQFIGAKEYRPTLKTAFKSEAEIIKKIETWPPLDDFKYLSETNDIVQSTIAYSPLIAIGVAAGIILSPVIIAKIIEKNKDPISGIEKAEKRCRKLREDIKEKIYLIKLGEKKEKLLNMLPKPTQQNKSRISYDNILYLYFQNNHLQKYIVHIDGSCDFKSE